MDHQLEGPQLITYVDRFGGDLAGLTRLLEGPLAGVFAGVHVLPYYTPFDGTDAGFDPEEHTEVDPRLGTWEDVRRLSSNHTVMSDVIVNHVSARSARFQDVLSKGDRSPWAPMFLTLSSVFPGGVTEADLARIYRPRPGLPFTPMVIGGERRLVWTTFTSDQVDIDLRTSQARAYLTTVIDVLTSAGVSVLRLDAVGYTGKEAGTDCFMTDSTSTYTQQILDLAHDRGAQVLLEIHAHHTQQVEIARAVDLVYDFALPPLVLHALHARDLAPLQEWLTIRPRNAVTVLDTHDGIGIIDVGPSDLRPGEPGLLRSEQINALVEHIHDASAGTSRLATGAAASNLDLYQVNCTFYDALGRDDRRYLLARLIQLLVPGIPQLYYVGLLAGANDMSLLAATGVGRDVNRHYYSTQEILDALDRPIVRAQLDAVRLRRHHPAFGGTFAWSIDGTSATMQWERVLDDMTKHQVTLDLDVNDMAFRLRATDEGRMETLLDESAVVPPVDPGHGRHLDVGQVLQRPGGERAGLDATRS